MPNVVILLIHVLRCINLESVSENGTGRLVELLSWFYNMIYNCIVSVLSLKPVYNMLC
jgi:hypothetical protein